MVSSVRSVTLELDSRPDLSGLDTAFLSTSYVQKLSDRFGRRRLLITLPLVATISTAAIMIACECDFLTQGLQQADKLFHWADASRDPVSANDQLMFQELC